MHVVDGRMIALKKKFQTNVAKARDPSKRSISPECNQRLEIEPENNRGETKTMKSRGE